MTVTGLNSDLYFANNPIYITFSQINIKTKYIEYFVNGSGVNPVKLYNNGRSSIRVDISQLVKLLFPRVEHNTDYTTLTPLPVLNNWVNASFIIKEVYKTGQEVYIPTLTKTFIDGGNRTYDSNQNYSVNNALIPANKIPQWGGYPIDYYYFNTSKQLVKQNTIPVNFKEERKIKGCNPVYIKFKNSKGGYSYWLFENSETEEKSKNLVIIQSVDYFTDLGNELEEGLTLTSKVPKKFMPMIFDLSSSKQIYIYLGNNTWEQVKNDNNSVKQNQFNENEKVKMKFQKVHRYNPTLLW